MPGPRDWQSLVDGEFTDVQKLVHLVFRQTTDNEQAIRAELVRARRREYEDTLTAMLADSGCGGRGRLAEGPILSDLNEMSRTDAVSIVNTYNYDMAIALMAIRQENPRANRGLYAKRLDQWESKRAEWKNAQIALNVHLTARSRAQADFMRNNGLDGRARLQGPDPAAEPLCQGWLNRGWVKSEVANSNPSPFHPGCPHAWHHEIDKASVGDCEDLWTGQ